MSTYMFPPSSQELWACRAYGGALQLVGDVVVPLYERSGRLRGMRVYVAQTYVHEYCKYASACSYSSSCSPSPSLHGNLSTIQEEGCVQPF